MVRVDDIQIQARDNDLVLGTHGRSVWVLDNISALEKMSDAVMASDVAVFDVPAAVQFRIYNRKGNTGHKWFSSPNPSYGAMIDYYLKAAPQGNVRITITDKSGKVVREMTGPKEAGVNRAVWDLRLVAPNQGAPGPAGAGGRGGGGGGVVEGGGGGGGRGGGGQQAPQAAAGETAAAASEPQAAPQLGGGGGGGGGDLAAVDEDRACLRANTT